MLDTYRRVLAIPGGVHFSAAGLFARLPISTVSLGIVLLVSGDRGYAYAGLLAAVYVIGSAVGAPLQGRASDRLGQHVVLYAVGLVYGLSVGALVASVELGWPDPVPHLIALALGASVPQAGSMVRARWSHVAADRDELSTAFALEAVVDEMVFVLGPVLVTFLATGLSPWAGLAAAGVAGTLGAWWLAGQRATAPPASGGRRVPGTRSEPLDWRSLVPLALASAGIGSLFGSVEVVTVAFADEQGSRASSGWMLAVFAAGSLLSGVAVGAMTLRGAALPRFRVGAVVLTLALAPLPFVPGIGIASIVLFVAGFAISPTLVAAVSVIEQTSPRSRLTEAMAWFSTGIGGGVAPGAAISGAVVDARGASVAFVVPLVSGALAAALAWAVRVPASSTEGASEPVPVDGPPPIHVAALDPHLGTLATYEAAADLYVRRTPAARGPEVLDLVAAVVAHVGPGGSVLEIGSGPGRDALVLEDHGVRVQRSDATASFVEIMRADGHDVLHLDVLDPRLVERAGGPYDAVFANAVLLHVEAHALPGVLRRLGAVVRPGGMLAFSTKVGDGAGWSDAKLELPRHFTYWRPDRLSEVLSAAGWRVVRLVEVRREPVDWVFVAAVRTRR